MSAKSPVVQAFSLLRSSVNNILSHPLILFPFLCVVFIQLLVLEILFFAHRYPLSIFFAPLIKFNNEAYMHYPYNFIFMTQWFQKAQMPIYVIFTCFFIGVAILIIDAINNGKKINLSRMMRDVLGKYVHILIAGVIIVCVMLTLSNLYGFLIKRALLIRSETGIYFIIKKIVLDGAPVANLFFAVIVTTLFAFLLPIIVLENKKIHSALIRNFKLLSKTAGTLLIMCFLPNLLYLPVLLLKINNRIIDNFAMPDLWALMIVLTVFIMFCIDAIVYTAITSYYLLQGENK